MQRRSSKIDSILRSEPASLGSAAVRRRRRGSRPRSHCRPIGASAAILLALLYLILKQYGYFIPIGSARIRDQVELIVSDQELFQSLRGRLRKTQNLVSNLFPMYPIKHDARVSRDVLDMCTKALWHTVETTTIVLPDGETFIHTGDIDDLWVRDSASQIHPLMMGTNPLIASDARLDRIVSGLIKRVAMYIRHDPYANAFRIDDTYVFNDIQRALGRHDLISTWNYELDSGCFYLRMIYYYWKQSPRGKQLGSILYHTAVQEAVKIMVDLWIAEQQHELDRYPTGPLFDCKNCNKPYRYMGLPRAGKGSPTNATAGLTWTGFRPSDDECMYGFHVPANMFAVVVLGYAVELATKVWKDTELAVKAFTLASEIDRGIQEHAIVTHPKFGKIYAYETDGLGRHNVMDDANVPSLLSIPYLGYHFDKEIYANTYRFIFSESNPTYRKGRNELTGEIEGYGSVHMSSAIKENIWPMSLAVKGLVSDSVEEKTQLAEILWKVSAGTGWMHESFDVNNPGRFTRSWFCWADSLFAELVMSITDECPLSDHKYKVAAWRDQTSVVGGQYAAASNKLEGLNIIP